MYLPVALLLAALFAWRAYVGARSRSSESPSRRRKMIAGGVAGIALGGVSILALPAFIPLAPGSPGAIAMKLALRTFGGVMLAAAVPSLVGALIAEPNDD